MSDYIIDNKDRIFNIWAANPKTRLYKNEMLRNHHLFNIIIKQQKIVNIIDIGCGTGYLDYLLSFAGKKITAVDLSERRLSLFKDIAREHNIIQINDNLFNIDMKGFDFVVSQEVLEHIEDYESALQKINHFIKKGGLGLFCVPYNENLGAKMITDPETGKRVHKVGHLHSFTKSKLINSFNKAGFLTMESFLLVNKRSFKLFAKFKIPVNSYTLWIDRFMNFLFPNKAAYLAILCKKN